jgi:hypothetical protein
MAQMAADVVIGVLEQIGVRQNLRPEVIPSTRWATRATCSCGVWGSAHKHTAPWILKTRTNISAVPWTPT